MKRSNGNVRPGQMWASSDPRRLSAFRVTDVAHEAATVEAVYPETGRRRFLPVAAFLLTGSKGYHRLS